MRPAEGGEAHPRRRRRGKVLEPGDVGGFVSRTGRAVSLDVPEGEADDVDSGAIDRFVCACDVCW